jgi:hypothetical protein
VPLKRLTSSKALEDEELFSLLDASQVGTSEDAVNAIRHEDVGALLTGNPIGYFIVIVFIGIVYAMRFNRRIDQRHLPEAFTPSLSRSVAAVPRTPSL